MTAPRHDSRDPRLLAAIEQASRWFVRLQQPRDRQSLQAQWHDWLQADDFNRQAWSRVEQVQRRFAQVPAHIGLPTLDAVGRQRRRTLQLALGGLAVAPMAWWLVDQQPWQLWRADVATARGEIRTLQLPDGSQLVLDSHSAVDIAFTDRRRDVILRHGRVFIETHADPAAQPRPFGVQTRAGEVLALGTQFVVSARGPDIEVRVHRHAVRLQPRDRPDAARQLDAGFSATFSAQQTQPPQPLRGPDFAAWRYGSLSALDLPLGQVIAMLADYRSGYLGVDAAVAALPVSGVFPLTNTDLALAALENSYPVKVRRLTPYWARVEARD